MKAHAAILAAAILAPAVPAAAEEIDLSKWTCRQYQAASKENVATIVAWLDGYYKNEDDPPVIDSDDFAGNAQELADYCAVHPDTTLITATDKLFQKE